MQGFSIRVAKGLNAMMKRHGRVFADRYHAHILATPTETRWAVSYVRRNYQKHMAEIGKPVSADYVDPFASPGANIELAEPRTWLLRRAAAPPDGSALHAHEHAHLYMSVRAAHNDLRGERLTNATR
jgi:hypothetical protein